MCLTGFFCDCLVLRISNCICYVFNYNHSVNSKENEQILNTK